MPLKFSRIVHIFKPNEAKKPLFIEEISIMVWLFEIDSFILESTKRTQKRSFQQEESLKGPYEKACNRWVAGKN